MKYEKVGEAFQRVEDAIGEDGEGMWAKRRRDMEREVRRRVPDFQVVVAFSQQHRGEDVVSGMTAVVPSSGAGTTPNRTRAALLAESAQRLLWLYQRCLPAVVAEARFDVGKLLHGFSVETQKAGGEREGEGEEGEEAVRRLGVVRRLHVLRLLKENDQFVWTGKIGTRPARLRSQRLLMFSPMQQARRPTAISLSSSKLTPPHPLSPPFAPPSHLSCSMSCPRASSSRKTLPNPTSGFLLSLSPGEHAGQKRRTVLA